MLRRDEFIKIGWKKFRLHEYNLAFENFNAALKLDQNSFEAHFGLGCVYLEMIEVEAISSFSKAIALNPRFAKTYYYRGFSNSLFSSTEKEETLSISIRAANNFIAAKTAVDYAQALYIMKKKSKTDQDNFVDEMYLKPMDVSHMQKHIVKYNTVFRRENDLFKVIEGLTFKEQHYLLKLLSVPYEILSVPYELLSTDDRMKMSSVTCNPLKSLFDLHIGRVPHKIKEFMEKKSNNDFFKLCALLSMDLPKDITNIIKQDYMELVSMELVSPKKTVHRPR